MIWRRLLSFIVRPSIFIGRIICRFSDTGCGITLRWLYRKSKIEDTCGCANRAGRIMHGIMGIPDPDPRVVLPESPLYIPAGGFSIHTNTLHMHKPIWSGVTIGCEINRETGEISGMLDHQGTAWVRIKAVDIGGRYASAELLIQEGTAKSD